MTLELFIIIFYIVFYVSSFNFSLYFKLKYLFILNKIRKLNKFTYKNVKYDDIQYVFIIFKPLLIYISNKYYCILLRFSDILYYYD